MILDNAAREADFDRAMAMPSTRPLAPPALDARPDLHAILGLRSGEAHVIRNAAGLAIGKTSPSIHEVPPGRVGRAAAAATQLSSGSSLEEESG